MLPNPSPLFLTPTAALQISEGSGTDAHRHSVAQIIIALDGVLHVRQFEDKPFAECRALLIPPNATHAFANSGPLALMMWFDPATAIARAMRARSPERIVLLSSAEVAARLPTLAQQCSALAGCTDAAALTAAVSRALLPNLDALPPLDERIVAAIHTLRDLPLPDTARPLAALAECVHLSESRLRHLFHDEIGVPIQHYWIGQRLLYGIRRWNEETSLTQIAHDAGFADSAHFSRAFRASFGLAPAATRQDSRSVQVVVCET